MARELEHFERALHARVAIYSGNPAALGPLATILGVRKATRFCDGREVRPGGASGCRRAYADHWKASGLFWATPADPARLVLGARNFLAVFCLGGFVLLLAAVWALFYERVWHAVLHAAFLGAGAHTLLQLAVMMTPVLPFARKPKRAELSGRLFWLFLVGMLFASLGPAMLPSVYARPWGPVVLAIGMIAVTTGLE